ncbi:hypothetical protein ACLQ3C_02740 [Gordonia sp. DT30]|uniref:hypothetical protein n=1 Tax=Gordonia sp. DT30 TaxID=3416546 RepID=UPI003CE9588C
MIAETMYPPELAEAVGYVVLEAAEAEDLIGELIVLRTSLTEPDPTWWASGETLAKAVEKIGDPALQPIVNEMRELLQHRNSVVHGLFLGGGRLRMTMKRGKSKRGEAPSYQLVRDWTDNVLDDLARRFRVLHGMVDDAISDAMVITRSS